jgi:hypothetical protein
MMHQFSGTITSSAVPLSPTSKKAAWVYFNNTSGPVFAVGGPGVTATTGVVVPANGERLLPALGSFNAYDLNALYIIGTSGPFNVTYFTL